MREIEFRGYDKELKKMTYFDDGEYDYILPLTFRLDQVFRKDSNYNDYEDFEWKDISNKVEIMQYTGLKDKNGKKIFEGDIVKKDTFDDTKPNFINLSYAKVVYIDELAGFYLVNNNNKILWSVSEDKYNIEVAGTIYDNPELLEEK